MALALAALAAAGMAGPAGAAGWVSPSASAVLGRPLDFSVQVRLAPGELLDPGCVSAEVVVGDRRLPAGLVNTSLVATGTDSARIRVTTDNIVDEPVVSVLLNAGCPSARFSRRFVVLADPPLDPAPAALPAALLPVAVAASSPAPAVATAAPAGGSGAAAADTGTPASPVATASDAGPAGTRAVLRAARPGEAAPASARQRQAEAARAARRAEQRAAQRAEQRAEQRVAARAARSANAARAGAVPVAARTAAPAARLRLEAPEAPATTPAAVSVDEALQAVAQAASAARAAASAAAVASARISTLEQTVSTLRSEVQAGRDVAADLRGRLARAEEAGRWTWPLLALVLLLTALAAWLVWRLNAAERARQRSWQAGAAAAGSGLGVQGGDAAGAGEASPSKLQTSPIPFVTSEIRVPPPAAARPRPAWPAPVRVDGLDTQPPPLPAATAAAAAPAASALAATGSGLARSAPRAAPAAPMAPVGPMEATAPMERTELLPQRTSIDDPTPRDVSIEELLDLEQQAEFFIVLGQDAAAIDLLVEHLRHTGGGSPLPYLKLLEIHRRRGDREDYERTRVRFNQRFNAYAPEWGTDLAAGRSLDSYTGVIPRLQKVWPKPLDAMAELEALLFRKSRGELFDLPAYREVLFLYSLARDLLDREPVDAGKVDLLLPLADGSEVSSTAPAPYLAPDSERGSLEAPATAPLDFDLSADLGRPTSIFGPLVEDVPPRGRSR